MSVPTHFIPTGGYLRLRGVNLDDRRNQTSYNTFHALLGARWRQQHRPRPGGVTLQASPPPSATSDAWRGWQCGSRSTSYRAGSQALGLGDPNLASQSSTYCWARNVYLSSQQPHVEAQTPAEHCWRVGACHRRYLVLTHCYASSMSMCVLIYWQFILFNIYW